MSSTRLKQLGALATVLTLLWIVFLYRQVPHSQTPFAKSGGMAARMVIEQGSQKVELFREGSDWKVAAGGGRSFPADESRVVSLISGLKDVQLEDEISDRADRASAYEVNVESGTRVHLLWEKDAKPAEGVFGKQAPDFVHIYFRYLDKPNIFLARGMMRGELGSVDSKSWRSHQLMDMAETTIQAITMEGKGFKTELVRTSTDVWTLGGKIVDNGPVNALVGTLAHLRCNDFVDPVVYPKLTYEALSVGRVIVKSATMSVELRVGALDAKLKQVPVSTSPDSGLAWLPESFSHTLQQKPSAFPSKK